MPDHMFEQTSGDRHQFVTDDLDKLLSILPEPLGNRLRSHPKKDVLVEVILDLGREPEARFPGEAELLSESVITRENLDYCISRVGHFSGDNRAGIERTLHRISAIRNRQGEIIGLTCRVGRAIFGTIAMIRDLVESGRSILLLGRPGVGKTTALREIARVLSDELHKRVVIIDTSNEIAGDGDIPHPAIGRSRRMQVARPEFQHQVMIEAVENHMPEVIVIDETIAERGVQLIGTAHGNQIDNLMKNPTLSDLVGGIQSVTLGDDEARRRGTQKSVLERKAPPTFEIAIEMLERDRWVVHPEVAESVDHLLRGRVPNPQVRTLDEKGDVVVTQERPTVPLSPLRSSAILKSEEELTLETARRGWGGSGQMLPLSTMKSNVTPIRSELNDFQTLLDESFQRDVLNQPLDRRPGPNGEDLPLHLYPYAVSRSQIDQIIQMLQLPIVLTKDIDHADVIFALRSHLKGHSKLKHVAKVKHVPIFTIKANSIPQIARGLRRLLNLEDPEAPEVFELNLLTSGKSDDEVEALEEARLAVEQIVLPKGQPVELLPRPARVRKMQHELIEHYRLHSQSFGEEPNRRLRIYPA
jgi:stage III sporulation protein SpoIIIAA